VVSPVRVTLLEAKPVKAPPSALPVALANVTAAFAVATPPALKSN
jgi:hypothetical protein